MRCFTHPAPFRIRSVLPSLLIVAVLYGHGWASSGTKPIQVVLPPLITRNAPPIWVEHPDSLVMDAGESRLLWLRAIDPDLNPISFSSFAAPNFVVLVDSGNGSGALVVTPAASLRGRFSMLLIVTDTLGAADSVDFTAIVSRLNHAPVWQELEIDTLRVREGRSIAVQVAVDDPDGDSLTVSTYGTVHSALAKSAEGHFDLIVAPEFGQVGAGAITIIAADYELADTMHIPLIVEQAPGNHPPVWSQPESDSISLLESAYTTLTLTVSDFDGDPLTISDKSEMETVLTHLGDGVYELVIAPALGDTGLQYARVIAFDGRDADTLEIAVLVRFNQNRNHPPVINNAPGDISLNINRDTVFVVGANDADGDLVTFTTLYAPTFVSLSERPSSLPHARLADVYVAPKTAHHGLFQMYLIASDGSLSDSASLLINVSNVNYWPEIGDLGHHTIAESDTMLIVIQASDANGSITTLSAFNLPANATFVDHRNNTGTFRFLPNYNQAGSYEVGIIVSDGSLRDTAYLSITIADVPRAPVFAPVSTQTVSEGGTIRIRVSATDPDNDPLTLAPLNLPMNASFVDSANGRGALTFSPAVGQLGPHSASLTASDGVVSDTLEILVISTETTVLPDSLQEVEYSSEQVAAYNAADSISQIRVEDLDLDGVAEVLFVERVGGLKRLRIWSPRDEALRPLPNAPVGIRSYTLRARRGTIEPVLWADNSQLLGLSSDGLTWETILTIPDSALDVQWLPENPGNWLVACTYNRSERHSGTDYFGCGYSSYSDKASVVMLSELGEQARFNSAGYFWARPNGVGAPLQFFLDGTLRDLFIFTYLQSGSYETGGNCGMPSGYQSADFSLGTWSGFDEGLSNLMQFFDYSCDWNWACGPQPSVNDFAIGFSKLRSHHGEAAALCYVSSVGTAPGDQTVKRVQVTVLDPKDKWQVIHGEVALPVSPNRGAVATLGDTDSEFMIVASGSQVGYALSIDSPTVYARVRIPHSGGFKSGYTLDTSHRELIFATATSILIHRLVPIEPERNVATTLHVPGQFSTIQMAINAAISGDTVLVAPGSYPGSINFLGKDIALISQGGHEVTTIVPASTTKPCVQFAAGESRNAMLKGFAIEGGGTPMVAIAFGANPTVSNNFFRGLTGTGDVMTIKSEGALITRNVFAQNSQARSIAISASGSADIVNNTFDRNKRGVNSDNPNTTMRNNIVSRHTGYGISGQFAVADYNNVWQNTPDYDIKRGVAKPPTVHDLSVDPMYRNTSQYRYDPIVESRCTDAGDPANEYRDPDGTRADIGAYAPAGLGPRPADFRMLEHEQFHVRSYQVSFTWDAFGVGLQTQTACRIQIGTDDDWQTAEMWDSGPLETGDREFIYDGSGLYRGQLYFTRLQLQVDEEWTPWVYSRIRLNSIPSTPKPFFPEEGGRVGNLRTSLIARIANDAEGDTIEYEFELYDDSTSSNPIHYIDGHLSEDSLVRTTIELNLTPDSRYWWRVRSFDGYERSEWSALMVFSTETSAVIRVPTDQPTIQFAVDAANDGDVVEVAPGIYKENVTIERKQVVLRSRRGADSTLIVQADTTLPILTVALGASERVEIAGFHLSGGTRTVAVRCEGGAPRISDCRVRGRINQDELYTGGGVALVNTNGAVVEGCSFLEIGYPSRGALTLSGSFDDTVRFNQFFANKSVFNLFLTNSSAQIYNNTVSGSHSGISLEGGSRADVRNNIIVNTRNSAINVSESDKDQITYGYNFYSGYQSSEAIQNSLIGNPQFIDTIAQNYGLLAVSQCIDGGDPNRAWDPDGSRPDIGAFPLGGRNGEPHLRLTRDVPSRVTDGPVIFNWGGFPIQLPQSSMELQIDEDRDWSEPPFWSSNVLSITDTSLTYYGPPLAVGQTYFYRIRVFDTAWSEWSHASLIVNTPAAIPVIIGPDQGAMVPAAGVTCSAARVFDPEDDPLKYYLEVSANSSMNDPVVTDSALEGSDSVVYAVVHGLAVNRVYWWRVRATDKWQESGWSSPRSFVTRAPTSVRVPDDFGNISEAIDGVGIGDSVRVGPGIYPPFVTSKGIAVVSTAGPSSTTIDLGLVENGWIRLGDKSTQSLLEGFTIRNGHGYLGVDVSGSPVTVRNNVFTGFTVSASILKAGSDSGTTIVQNLFYSNRCAECIGLHTRPARILNNTLYENTGGFFTHDSNAVAIGNIVVGCSTFSIWGSFDTATYNVLWDNAQYDSSGFTLGDLNLNANPRFIDPSQSDFHLASNSPCIDAGHPDPQYNDPDGSRNDIGAFPYVTGLTAKRSDDLNHDGVVDVRDAVRLIDQTVRDAKITGEPQTMELHRVRGMIERLWGRPDRDKQK